MKTRALITERNFIPGQTVLDPYCSRRNTHTLPGVQSSENCPVIPRCKNVHQRLSDKSMDRCVFVCLNTDLHFLLFTYFAYTEFPGNDFTLRSRIIPFSLLEDSLFWLPWWGWCARLVCKAGVQGLFLSLQTLGNQQSHFMPNPKISVSEIAFLKSLF